jgi:hypothetical protein
MTPFFRTLLLLLALLSPAFAQDGPGLAAGAKQSAHALDLYIDAVAKAGGRPAYHAPPASALLQKVFDVDRLAALPATQSSDIGWLRDWSDATFRAHDKILLFGVETTPTLDQTALQRNLTEFEDQLAAAMNFQIRLQARLATATSLFWDQLAPGKRTPERAAGLKATRAGVEKILRLNLISIAHGIKFPNARLLSAAIRDTRDVWAAYIPPDDRALIANQLKLISGKIGDAEVEKNLRVFADVFVVAK